MIFRLNSYFLKKVRILLLIIFYCSGFENLFGQADSDSLVKEGVNQISLTRQGQILASDAKSNIFLFDSTGKLLYQFSPRRPGKIHLLEGWNSLRPFAFYRDFQEFVILDRFLLADGPNALDPEKTGYARLVAPSLDGNLWILDESNFNLKKVDIRNQQTLFSSPLDLILNPKNYDICFMQEYQNQLYIVDKQGYTLVFDQMGNFRKKLPFQKTDWIGFYKEEAYSLQNDSIQFFNPYSLKTRKIPLPEKMTGAKRVTVFKNQFIWLDEHGLRKYKMK